MPPLIKSAFLPAAVLLAVLLPAVSAAAKVKVAASLTDLASIASYVGGDRVEVFAIAKPSSNPHFVEVLPSYMIKVSRADVYLKVGLDLDHWADAILDGSRNAGIAVVDCSAGMDVLEKPAGKVDASMGDVHARGNPHYWLDPANGAIIAGTVRDALSKADPSHAAFFAANAEKFRAEAEAGSEKWRARMAPLKGAALVTYHSSWSYFAKAFGLRIIGQVEPYPGIPPTARHLQGLVDGIRAGKARILIQEPYFAGSGPKFLERETGIRIHRFTPSCEGAGPRDYFRHFDSMTEALADGAGRP